MNHERPGSRRDFFLDVCNKVIDGVHIQLRTCTHSRINQDKTTHHSSEIQLGEIHHFPVNEVIPLAELKVEVISDSAGLRVRDSNSPTHFAMRLGPYGKIWMDRSKSWEPNAVLCLMTGEKKLYDRL